VKVTEIAVFGGTSTALGTGEVKVTWTAAAAVSYESHPPPPSKQDREARTIPRSKAVEDKEREYLFSHDI
jgi:hypothetical protein